ncbi:MAG: hypothetical protein JO331_04630, partial [Verrucomicrobia bacterium]|nr:hypothetical protein [Verrucomicrobiota bacterium]
GQTRLQLLQEEWMAAEARRTALALQLEEAQSQQEKNQGLLESCRQAVRDAEHDAAARQKELQQLDRELSQTQRSLAERESKHEALGQLNEEGAGLGPGTQAVLKGLDNPQLFRPAILGALANLIEVDREFLPAVEAALGEQLQTVLIGDETVAEALGQALVAGDFGRAALVPRSAYLSFSGVQMEATPAGALGWALDRIKVRPEALQFAHRALAKVVLALDLPIAMEIKRANRDLAVATLGGEFISESGVITAGKAAGNRNSVLERKLQIRALQSECETLRRSFQELENEKQALQAELDEAQRRLTEARETVQRAQVSVSTQVNAIELLERELHELEGKTKSLAFERGNTEQRVRSAVDREQSLVAELETKTTELNLLQEQHASVLAEIDGLRSQEEQFNDELNDLKVRVATERQRSENLQRQRQPMANRLHELQDFVQARQADIRAYAAKIQQWETEIASLREKLVELENEKVGAEQAVGRLLEERSARVNAVEAVENSLRQLRHQLGESQKARGEKEVLSTQLKLRLESLQEHVSRRYQTDLALFESDWHGFRNLCRRLLADRLESTSKNCWDPDFPSSSGDWEHVKTLVTEMNDRLDGMGPVNLEAIQEYDELEERQRFLDEQNADLVRSKSELLDVINKINLTTQQLFADTFEQVRRNFQEMFAELFGGGKANLLLVDDTDPLESGIEIIAKPPGKQLQSITLLSGGEKTMTAVALLFAIYMVKPSPFCVLDEMDAPLDESNINRFIKVLDRF